MSTLRQNRAINARVNVTTSVAAIFVIVLAVLAVHMLSLFLPYYFVDDLWLYHYPAPGFPDAQYVRVIQGRPAMMLIMLMMRGVRAKLGVESMLVIRAVGVLGLTAFAVLVFRFLRLWMEPLLALVLTVLLITLPSYDMYVSAAPLFAPALAYCGIVALAIGHFMQREDNARRQWLGLVAAIVGLVAVWATYQAIPLVVVGLFAPMLLSNAWASNPRWKRLLSVLVMLGMSLVIYYVWWRLANRGLSDEGRYSPQIGRFYLFSNWQMYAKLRFSQIFGFWDVRFPRPPYELAAGSIVALAFVLDVVSAGTAWPQRTLAWGCAVAAIVAVDVPVLLAPPSNTFTYMTSAPSATAVFLLTAVSAIKLLARLVIRIPSLLRVSAASAIVLCGSSVVLAARTVAVNHVLPNWLEYSLARDQLRRELAAGPVSAVTIHTRPSLLGIGAGEFQWSNFQRDFWTQWAVRDILDELGTDSNIRIDVVAPDGTVSTTKEAMQAADFRHPASGRRVTIDLRALDLREPPGSLFRESPSLEGLPPVPADLSVAAIDRISSTMVFDGHGARGEKALVDGDPSTAAADPGGFNPRTSISLHLSVPVEVAAVRVLTAKAYGVALYSTLEVRCRERGTPRTLGRLVIKPGLDLASQSTFDAACTTQDVELTAVAPTSAANFWLSEVQVLGRPPK